MDSWGSYSKIFNIGHPQARDLFEDEVVIEEKIDGSQFSFGVFNGRLRTRSKGREFEPEGADDLFRRATDTAQRLAPQLHDGWTYRGEVLSKPKHNALAYDRVPHGNFILFDIGTGMQTYLSYEEKAAEAARLGLEIVPKYFEGRITTKEQLLDITNEFLQHLSVLGGAQVEGFVVKNYKRFSVDGKVLMGKHVSERFKEIKEPAWRESNPAQGDILDILVEKFATKARWHKAVQHLREAGTLLNEPKDIGPLIAEVRNDIDGECAEIIKNELYSWFKKRASHRLTHGLAEWYKEQLLEGAIGGGK